MNTILIATTNKVKFDKISSFLKKYNLDYVSLSDLNLSAVDINEDEKTTYDNAIKKVETYFKLTSLPCIATDSGIYIDNIPDNEQLGLFSGRKITFDKNGNIINETKLTPLENYKRIGTLIKKHGGNIYGKLIETYAFIDVKGFVETVEIQIPRQFIYPGSLVFKPHIEARSYIFSEHYNKYLAELTDEEIYHLDSQYFDTIDGFFKKVSQNKTLVKR